MTVVRPSSTSTSGRVSAGIKPCTHALKVSLISRWDYGIEHQRALAQARDAREHRQTALGDVDAHVLEVVLSWSLHPDEVMAVGDMRDRLVDLICGGIGRVPHRQAQDVGNARRDSGASFSRTVRSRSA